MSVVTAYAIGTFCPPGLCSGDAADSKEFYASVFGWEPADMKMPEGSYTMFKVGGESVAGMYQMAEERKKAGVVPHWNTYLAVASADETAKKAAALGGKVIMQPFDAGSDRMANLQDPTGAKFSVWESRGEPEPARINEVGALCWTELYTRDGDKASSFYSELFGWHAGPWNEGPMPYVMFKPAEAPWPIGGMIVMPDDMQGEPHWLPYFQVNDADEKAELARKLGGKICHAPMDIPTIGRMAIMSDRQGAGFAVIRLNG